jgi:TolA-binding protein
MNGPKRFLASGGFKADLLASARGDRPSQGSRRRALVAAGAAAAATSSTGLALGSSVGGSVVRWAIWKWVAVGVASTAAVVTARTIIAPGPDTRTVIAQAETRETRETKEARTGHGGDKAKRLVEDDVSDKQDKPGEDSQSGALTGAEASAQAAVVPGAVAPKKSIAHVYAPALQTSSRSGRSDGAEDIVAPAPPASSQLATEIATLDQAKHAVKSGDATRALHILDSYEATFSHGALAPEASALRIEALARAGRHSEAQTELGAFRARHPESPLLGVLSGIVREGS